jgi:hypothetical protein
MADTNELIGAGMPALQASLLGDGNATRSTYNGVGVIPASHATAGFEITSNYSGDGAVNFWNLVNKDNINVQGFDFRQKTGAATFNVIGALFSNSTTSVSFELYQGAATAVVAVSATEISLGSAGSVPVKFYGGAAGATLLATLGATGGFTLATGAFGIPTSTPASAAAAGVAGTIAWDASFLYVCVTTNTWKRVAIATW